MFNVYPEGFANFGYFYGFLIKSHSFYTLDMCGNGYWRNIVTTSLFMTLLLALTFFLKFENLNLAAKLFFFLLTEL